MSDVHAALEAEFPGYREREPFEAGRFRGAVLKHERDVRRHTCYVHGYEVDDDVEVIYGARVLVLPAAGGGGWCVLSTSGHTLSSVRYDQDGRSLSCRLDDGETFALERSSYHQKAGRPNYTERGDLARLATHLRERMGYPGVEAEGAAELVAAFARAFCG